MFKKIFRKIVPNPFDRLLKGAQRRKQKKFLLAWNRGLGDIPLGLYAIIHRIRTFIPDALITFITRKNLQEGFTLLENVECLIAPDWERGKPYSVEKTLQKLQKDPSFYELIIEYPDPTYWVKWQHGKLTPKLKWDNQWDDLWKKYSLKESDTYIGVHPHTETQYGFSRNFPVQKWQELFDRISRKERKILLFGFEKKPPFSGEAIIDLRGETNLYELLSIIKNRCSGLIVLDSGISAMTYFLDCSFPIRLVSLWGNPDMGILKQNVASPNPQLSHFPILGRDGKMEHIEVDAIERALFA